MPDADHKEEIFIVFGWSTQSRRTPPSVRASPRSVPLRSVIFARSLRRTVPCLMSPTRYMRSLIAGRKSPLLRTSGP